MNRLQFLLCLALSLAVALGGCGLAQKVKDGTVDLTRSVFFAQTKTVKLDLLAREELNSDDKSQPLSVVVRVYQLRDGKRFASTSYEQLLTEDKVRLADDLLASKEVILLPGASLSLDEPLDKDAKQIGVAAFFRKTDVPSGWQLLIGREQLSDETPFRILAQGYRLQPDTPAQP
ncbi:type VI secretion system lipoprotein TssJ [Andreprevotia chitinilytica]|uniref:type VI secretion system lipoprotein TssJ n=1 Tax=Andreprevotia chitinilytica TaxID=396808 RepID=UPI00054F83F1|nr:type VI secretion system lipoprotein TssJ [Andreprevotia chitinilytica]